MIPVTDIYKRFIYIVDKFGDPSFTDVEFSTHWNNAQDLVFLETFNSSRQRGQDGKLQYAFEMSETDADKWRSLVKPLTINTDNTGKLTLADIETALGDRKVFHLSAKQFGGKMAVYVRHNDYSRWLENGFLKFNATAPWVRIFDDHYQFYPQQQGEATLACVLYPRPVVLDFEQPSNNVDVDLTWSAAMDVLFKTCQMAGIQIREAQFYEMTKDQESKL